MILYRNGFIEIGYEPATDILSFEMPTVNEALMPEMGRCLSIVVEHARSYDVKRILLDARKTDLGGANESYGSTIREFYLGLMGTRTRRVARLVSPGSEREGVVSGILARLPLSLDVEAFTHSAPAVRWLTSET